MLSQLNLPLDILNTFRNVSNCVILTNIDKRTFVIKNKIYLFVPFSNTSAFILWKFIQFTELCINGLYVYIQKVKSK